MSKARAEIARLLANVEGAPPSSAAELAVVRATMRGPTKEDTARRKAVAKAKLASSSIRGGGGASTPMERSGESIRAHLTDAWDR